MTVVRVVRLLHPRQILKIAEMVEIVRDDGKKLAVPLLVKHLYNQTNIISLQLQNIMQKNSCLACRTAFQDGELLPPETMSTEYKEYLLPLREERVRWDVLKTIVSFLNSYGGVLYLAIDHAKGTVMGQKLEKKEQDTFKLFMKQLLQKVHPKVDLKHRQEVAVQFVPLLRKKQFAGKYVAKIIVQQGDPSQVYYFGEKIKLESQSGKTDQIQVFYAYERDNMGGMTQIKGVQLLKALHERGTNPNDEVVPSHQGCNPQPPHLELQIRKIHFNNLTAIQYSILDSTLETYFRGVDYDVSYQQQKKSMLVEFDDIEEFKLVIAFMHENLEDLNRNSFRIHDIFLQIKGEMESNYLIENNPKPRKIEKEEKSNKKQQKYLKQFQQKPIFNHKQLRNNRQIQKNLTEPDRKPKPPPNNFPKKFSLTIANISPHTSKQLQSFLINSICKKSEKYVTRYMYTLQVFLKSENELGHFCAGITKNQQILATFGRGGILIGRNSGCLRIFNCDKNRREEMASMLQAQMGMELRQIQLVKQGNHFSYVLQMKDKPTACIWLDNLLQSKCLSQFSDKTKLGRAGRIFVRLEME